MNMNIRYNKKITISNKKDTRWQLDSDKGSHFEMSEIAHDKTMWGNWWHKQHQSDLRLWQKDIFRDFANSLLPSLTPLLVYRPNQGYNQSHDVMIARAPEEGFWLLSTENDFWIINNDYGHFDVTIEDSLGSILDETVRKTLLYPIIDTIQEKTL